MADSPQRFLAQFEVLHIVVIIVIVIVIIIMTIVVVIVVNNRFAAHDKLGMCWTSLVSPKQSGIVASASMLTSTIHLLHPTGIFSLCSHRA